MSTQDPGWGSFTQMPGADSAPPVAAPSPSVPAAPGAAPAGGEPSITSLLSSAGRWKGLASLLTYKGKFGNSPAMKKPWVRVIVIILGVLAIVSGVRQIRGAGTSKSSFIEKADRLCTAIAPNMQAALQQGNAQQVVQLRSQALNQIRSLDQPKKDKDKLERIYAVFEADIQALNQGDFQSDQTLMTQVASDSSAYGFSACGQG